MKKLIITFIIIMALITSMLIASAGFYKLENEELLYAPNRVTNTSYTLNKEEKDKYKYPVGGWSWFDTYAEACTFFDVEPPEDKLITLVEEIKKDIEDDKPKSETLTKINKILPVREASAIEVESIEVR